MSRIFLVRPTKRTPLENEGKSSIECRLIILRNKLGTSAALPVSHQALVCVTTDTVRPPHVGD